MTNRIETIRSFNGTCSFGTPANRIAKSEEATQAYRDLSNGEIAELIQVVLTGDDDIQQILGCLACLHPGSLKRFHREFIQRRFSFVASKPHDERLLPNTHEQIAVEQKANAAEHFLLGDAPN
jgi:hypothetical protein